MTSMKREWVNYLPHNTLYIIFFTIIFQLKSFKWVKKLRHQDDFSTNFFNVSYNLILFWILGEREHSPTLTNLFD